VNKKFSKNFSKSDFFGLDGIIVLTAVVQDKIKLENIEQMKEVWGNIPFVSVGQIIENVPSIISESENSMKELIVHLIEYHKYKNILFLGGRDSHQDNILREQKFIDMMNQYKSENQIDCFKIIRGDYTEESAIQALFNFENQNNSIKFDVIVCANDNMAIGVNKYLKMYQSSCFLDNCAVTGFDDIPQAKLEYPALTTVRQPMEEMGNKALEIMTELLKGKKVCNIHTVRSSLVIRNSCGCPKENETSLDELQIRNQKTQYQYLYSEKLLRMISRMGQELNSVFSIQEMRTYIDRNLDLIGIKNFCLLSFSENNGTLSEYVYPLFVRKNGKMDKSFYSVPKTLMSTFCDSFFDWKESYVSKFLLLGRDAIGIMIYQAEETLHPYMCSISVDIAQTILRLKNREEEFKYAETLEKEVQERTKELLESNNRRIEVEAQVLKISEAERQRFSTDLHDDICQRLAGISMLCRSYSNREAPLEKHEMEELAGLISDTLQRTRQYAHNSYPVELESLGMNRSLNNLCASFETQSGIKCVYEWNIFSDIHFDSLQKLNIFRIIQEALHNVLKHSKATEVVVNVEEENDFVLVTIKDNGVGFSIKSEKNQEIAVKTNPDEIEILSAKDVAKGIGLNSMQYRADQINASFKIKKNKPCGTCVELKVFPH
jgi:signal transduction histidine kinase